MYDLNYIVGERKKYVQNQASRLRDLVLEKAVKSNSCDQYMFDINWDDRHGSCDQSIIDMTTRYFRNERVTASIRRISEDMLVVELSDPNAKLWAELAAEATKETPTK